MIHKIKLSDLKLHNPMTEKCPREIQFFNCEHNDRNKLKVLRMRMGRQKLRHADVPGWIQFRSGVLQLELLKLFPAGC